VTNKCAGSLMVHIGTGDRGQTLGKGQVRWGTNGAHDRTWASQSSTYGYDTLAEIHDANGHIWYDISLVDGFTYPMSLVPVGGSGGKRRNLYCRGYAALTQCPNNLKLKVGNTVKACKNHSANPKYFKARCPDAYSWSGDDQSSMADTNKPSYMEVTFCP
jgi:hypothetical protein